MLNSGGAQIVMDWLGKLLGLSQRFLSRTSDGSLGPGGGVIQGTASEAALVCLLAARARIMEGRPTEDMAKLVAYSSDQVIPLIPYAEHDRQGIKCHIVGVCLPAVKYDILVA